MVYAWAADDKLSERRAQIFLLIFACICGADYLMDQPRKSLDAVEHVIPLQLLGGLFLFFGILGIIGELWMEIGYRKEEPWPKVPYICSAENRWWPSFTAYTGLCAIYMALGFFYLTEMGVSWHLWGGRNPALMFGLGFVHWSFAQKRKYARL